MNYFNYNISSFRDVEKEINDLERKVDRVDSKKAVAPFEYTPVEITKIINNIEIIIEVALRCL